MFSYKAGKQEISSSVDEKRNNGINNTTLQTKILYWRNQNSEIPYWQKE